MFKTNENKYLYILNKADLIYKCEVEPKLHFRTFGTTASDAKGIKEAVVFKYRNLYIEKEENMLFNLNILLNNNESFKNALLNSFINHFSKESLNHIAESYFFDFYPEKWDNIVETLANWYFINKSTVKRKISEILSYPNLYNVLSDDQNTYKSNELEEHDKTNISRTKSLF